MRRLHIPNVTHVMNKMAHIIVSSTRARRNDDFARLLHVVAFRVAGRARVTSSASLRYIIDAAEAFKLSWKYRPAVRVINVPPSYKVLNFRSVRRRNISRNTATAAQRNAAVYQTGENYSADEDVNIGELYRPRRKRARARGTHCFDKRAPGRTLWRSMRNSVVDAADEHCPWTMCGR